MNGIHCIIGLGNPGSDYATTRHNVGAWFVDFLAEQNNASFKLTKKLHGFLAEFSLDHQKIILFKPITYMNDSGRSILALAQFYKIPVESMLIVHDELDFDVGIARLKKSGGHGGHNGLRDTIACLNSAEFYRLRLGIGHPGNRDDVVDYVLKTPSKADREKIMTAIEDAAAVIPSLMSGEVQKAFHQLHSD